MKWCKKKVDERQEMELLKAEHVSFWCMYYLLLASIFIQYIAFGFEAKAIAGEWVVLMLSSIILVAACIRKGVWSFGARKLPGVKDFFIYSLITMVLLGLPFGIWYCIKAQLDLRAGVVKVAFTMISFFAISFVAFWAAGTLAKKQETKLTEEDPDEENEV